MFDVLRFLGSDVDKSGLNAWENGFDLAEVEVPDDARLVGLLIHELDEATVLDNGHPGLGAQGVNHDLALHFCPYPVCSGARSEAAGAMARTAEVRRDAVRSPSGPATKRSYYHVHKETGPRSGAHGPGSDDQCRAELAPRPPM